MIYAAIGLGIVTVCILPLLRMREWILPLVLLPLTVLPVRLLGTTAEHVGIAGAAPRIMTYTIPVLAVLVAGLVLRRIPRIPAALYLFCVYIVAMMILVWPSDPIRLAGLFTWVQAIICFGIGIFATKNAFTDERFRKLLVLALVFAVCVQFVVSVAQALGASWFAPDAATAELVGSRVNGTFNHPTALGKALFLAAVLLLMLANHASVPLRTLCYLTVAASLIPQILSESRANIVAAAVLILGSLILIRRRPGQSSRKIAIGAILAMAAPFVVDVLLERFLEDPDGGGRNTLIERTLSHIHRVLPFGAGPNSFVEVFGQWDSLIADGWPVHNVPLLLLSELGYLGLALLAVPVISTWWRSLSGTFGAPSIAQADAAIVVASIPGWVAIGATGWGFLHEYTLPLAMFTLGASFVAVRINGLQPVDSPEPLNVASSSQDSLGRLS